MLVVGLTGGIGCGKSTVAKIFNTLNIPVFDADTEAKLIMLHDEQLKLAIQQLLGSEAYTNEGLNKPFIANKIFNNRFLLEQMNALVHPFVINAFKTWASSIANKAPYCIKEAALLFEAGTAGDADFIIGVDAPQAMRILRVMRRDGVTESAVKSRMQQQINTQLKMKLCDAVVVNDEIQLLMPQILEIHHRLLRLAAMKKAS